jgi:signal transduction histidine kinase
MRSHIKHIILIVACIFCAFYDLSGNTFKVCIIDNVSKIYPIEGFAYVYEDTSSKLKINDILKISNRFVKDTNHLTFGATYSRYWARLSFKNIDKENADLILLIENPDINLLDFYIVKDSSVVKHFSTGENIKFDTRDIENRNFAFSIIIKPDETCTCYISSCNQGDANFLPISLFDSKTFYYQDNSKVLTDGFRYGLFLFIILFNIFLFILMKNRIYIYYGLYVFFISLFYLNLDGYSYQYFWPNLPWWSNHSIMFFMSIASYFQIVFTQKFLYTKELFKRTHTLLICVKYAFVASILFSVLSHAFLLFSIYVIWILTPIVLFLTIYISIIGLKKFKQDAIYFLLARCFTLFGGLLYVFKDLDILPGNFLTINSLKFGILFEALILTFAVVDRFRRELKEKNKQLVLHQTELIISRDKAEESDRLKSSFLANMSHEIRTPMNAILGFSSLLPEPSISAEKKQFFCKIIEERTKDLLRIINDVLDISKIEVKQMSILESDGNLRDLINQLYEYYKSMIENQEQKKSLKLKVSYEIPDEYSSVCMDFVRLNQIISNFIDNAIKFTKEGSVEFGCRKEENRLLFFVKDTGIGIPKEKQNIIFDRFRQADESTSKAYGGTGLGLSISKGLIDLMKGEIWMESEEKKGTAFYIKLPYRPASPVTEEIYFNREKNASLIKKLLIVEDDIYNTTFIKELLSKSSFVCRYVETGKDAIEEINKNSDFDLVLLDIRLPDINGKDVAKYIKAKHPGIKIIAQTAYASDRDRKSCMESGCDGYISKPYDKHSFMNIIYRYLKN